jgi:carboxymethylenebutenolidase
VQESRLTSGFATAVEPVSSGVITTSAEGLEAGEVAIPVPGGGEIPAYRAVPAKRKGAPVILVIHEIFGVDEHIKDVCRPLARRGYMAVAPELFFRQGGVSGLTGIEEIHAKVVSKAPEAQVMSDLDAAAAWAAKSGGGALGVTGFCWGGRMVWLYAAHKPDLKAPVAWYGRLAGPASEISPNTPLDVAGVLKAPVLGLYGGQDPPSPWWTRCAKSWRPPGKRPRFWSTPKRRTPSSPTIAPATAKTPPSTAGGACSTGSPASAWPARSSWRTLSACRAGTRARS